VGMSTFGAVRPSGGGEAERRGAERRRILVTLAPLGVLALACCALVLSGGSDSHAEAPVSEAMSKAEVSHMFRDKVFLQDYPKWARTVEQINAAGAMNHGVWKYYKGPPFLQRVTMFSGNDVDITTSGNLVRRVLGLPLSFGKWEGNSFVKNFDSQQMRFLASNEHSALVIPPLTLDNTPLLPDSAKALLHQYIAVGHNTLVVCGGPAAVNFINMNFLGTEGERHLEPAWTRGPYEKQDASVGTPFQSLPVTLPNVKNHAHGVRKQSLPHEAVSYFETDGISVVFSLPFGGGQMMFVGFDYTILSRPWVKTLIAAAQFAS